MTPASQHIEGVIAALVRDVPDFPERGVLFKDICPLLADSGSLAEVVDALSAFGRRDGAVVVDKVAGVEARGFMLAVPVALALGVGFVPVRKAGKLPGPTYQQRYTLEYGESTIEIQRDAFSAGERVLVVDDVLATGGTLQATAALVARSGAQVSACCVVIELGFLAGRESTNGFDLHALTVM